MTRSIVDMPVPRQEAVQTQASQAASKPKATSNQAVDGNVSTSLEQLMSYADLPNEFESSSGLTVRQNIYISGEEGSGKTGFIIRHCPGPIALIGYDGRAREEVEKAHRRGEIVHYLNIPWSKLGNWSDSNKLKAEAREVLTRTVNNLKWAVGQSLKYNNIGTICLDGGSELSEIIDLAFDGKAEDRGDVFGKDSNYVGKRLWGIYELINLSKAHFVITTRASLIFENDDKGRKKASGKHKYKGNKVIGQASNWGCHLELDPSRHEGVSKKTLDPEKLQVVEISKAGRDLREQWKRYTKDDWEDNGPFAFICWKQNRELFPEMTVEDWRKKP
jgi:hypothetical protein